MEKKIISSICFHEINDLKSLNIAAGEFLSIEIMDPNVYFDAPVHINLNRNDSLKLLDFLNFAIKNK